MSSILTAFDVSELHAMGDLELVMLWQSLICYQQKHLWLIGHIRTHHWAVVCIYIYIYIHTHTHRHALFLSQICIHANYTLTLAD